MTPAVGLIVASALMWLMLVVAALARSRAGTAAGMRSAFGNRDDLPAPTPFAARADRAARNMVENFALFGALLLAARWAQVPDDALALPCALFVGGRLAYTLVYWAGVRYVRTLVWGVSLVGLGWIGVQAAV